MYRANRACIASGCVSTRHMRPCRANRSSDRMAGQGGAWQHRSVAVDGIIGRDLSFFRLKCTASIPRCVATHAGLQLPIENQPGECNASSSGAHPIHAIRRRPNERRLALELSPFHGTSRCSPRPSSPSLSCALDWRLVVRSQVSTRTSGTPRRQPRQLPTVPSRSVRPASPIVRSGWSPP